MPLPYCWNKKNASLKLDVIDLSELPYGNRQGIHLKHCMGLKIKPLFRRTNKSYWHHKMTAEKCCALSFDFFHVKIPRQAKY